MGRWKYLRLVVFLFYECEKAEDAAHEEKRGAEFALSRTAVPAAGTYDMCQEQRRGRYGSRASLSGVKCSQ